MVSMWLDVYHCHRPALLQVEAIKRIFCCCRELGRVEQRLRHFHLLTRSIWVRGWYNLGVLEPLVSGRIKEFEHSDECR